MRSFVIAAFAASCSCAVISAEEELPSIAIEASRGSVLPLHFAGSATVIDADTIRNSGSRSVAELLAARGGIRISSTSGNLSGGQIHLRGFGENSSSRVLLLLDGQPVNRPDMAGVSLLEIPLSRIERIEILRGSQTARFGDNAVGGVINFITRKEGTKARGFLESAAGSDAYFLSRGGFSVSGFSFDAERNFTDGWRENSASEIESAALRWSGKINTHSELTAGLAWSDEFTGIPGPLGKEEYEDDPRQSIYAASGFADQYFSEQETWRGNAAWLWNRDAWGFEVPVAYSRRDQGYNIGPGSHTDNLLETSTIAPVVEYSGDKWSVQSGINWRHDSLDIDRFAEIQRENRTAQAELSRDIAGIFATMDREIFDGWHLGAGGRVEHSMTNASAKSSVFPEDPEQNFSRESGEWNQAFQLGLRRESDVGITSWLRWDRLYRLPSTDEIASYQGFPLSVPFNDQLRAEKGYNIELGMEWLPGDFEFGVNGFAQWLEGEITYDYLRNINVNLADTRRLGLEWKAGYRSPSWEVDIHYTWLNAEYQSGDHAGKQVYLVPNHELGAVMAWHPFQQATIQAEYQFKGESFEGNDFENEREKLPSYGVANLLLRYEPKPGMSVYLRVNNLTDERYATVKYSGVWYPAAGRQWQLGVRGEF